MMLLGVDTGGTFTDFVFFDGSNIQIHKVLSTPASPELAILHGIQDLGLNITAEKGLYIIHGSTVGTNAVLEGKGVKTAYITNRGLHDILTLGRQTRKELYNLCPEPQRAPVPDELCFELDARLAADGTELQKLSKADLQNLKQQLEQIKPDAVAINMLFSFLDDQQELEIEKFIPEGVFVSRSSHILPEYKEYERGVATWLNAWIGPIMQQYLSRLESATTGSSLSVMQSTGGTIAAGQAGKKAVQLLLSGPAGGLAGAQYTAACSGYQRLLTFDMGGTSTDVAMIDGEIQLTNEGAIGSYPVAVPMVDMHTIGAGGGSIAYVDEGGLLRVGPESAGADPGPACYGRGGNRATVTDANLVLGRLQANAFLGGKMRLDMVAAQSTISDLAEKLNLSVEETALGVIRIVNENMARALRVMSAKRGIEPDKLVLVSFGGAGGLHVCALAEALKIRQAMIPVNAGVLSALGMIVAPRSRLLSRSVMEMLEQVSVQQLETYFNELREQGLAALVAEGLDESELTVEKSVDLRYRGQSYYLNIHWPELGLVETMREILSRSFHEAHKRYHGHDLNQSVELVNIRLSIKGPETELPLKYFIATSTESENNNVSNGRFKIISRERLKASDIVYGPALIVETVSTTYVESKWKCEVDNAGNLLLSCCELG